MLSRRVRAGARRCSGLLLQAVAGLAACKPEPPAAPAPPVAPEPAPAPEPPPLLAEAPAPPILVRGVGFQSPHSMVHDVLADVYLLSNVNGAPGEADGNGFISRLAPDGTLLDLRWIDGQSPGVTLDAPRGLALVGDTLFVADLNVLRSFDRQTGKPSGKVAILQAHLLSDVAAAPYGGVYVSDLGLGQVRGVADLQKLGPGAIYAVDPRGLVEVFARGESLGQPSALWVGAEGLLAVNAAGLLQRFGAEGTPQLVATLPARDLRGVLRTPAGRLLVASAESSTIYVRQPPPADSFEPFITELGGPGDIGYDVRRRQLLVPLAAEDAVYIQQVPGELASGAGAAQ